ncbi:mutator-like element transposase [Ceratocystis lukuohia]|uniref:Mutator-like element transposase n=1 Tax=Ceratocystis lukuohia TaxID=2019550 RepID=A0ABR4MAH8_9PEZI
MESDAVSNVLNAVNANNTADTAEALQISRFPDDILPPEGIYESREALFAAANAWAKPRGYAFTTGKSKKTNNGRTKVVVACDRTQAPPNPSTVRRRRTSSRGTGCKFSVLAKESADKNTWALVHRPDQEYAQHNHPPSDDPSAHPIHRALQTKDVSVISGLVAAGVAPRNIRSYLYNTSDTLATAQDIRNQIALVRRDSRHGQSSIQALIDQLNIEGFRCQVRVDSGNHLTALFFAHPDSIAYLQENPDVLLLDCTYKTNRYAMPLLEMIGVNSSQKSFYIAFAFLSGETEDDYLWALQHLKSLYQQELPSVVLTDRCQAILNAVPIHFPSAAALLCLWHANKAVLQHCQPAFGLMRNESPDSPETKAWGEFYGCWHSIIASPDEETYKTRVEDFRRQYASQHFQEVGYVLTYWLNSHKERLVKAWVDKCLHFGNTATSRVEGIHWLIKSHLGMSSRFDLFDACQAIKRTILAQIKELRQMQASQKMRVPLDIPVALFEAVHGWVSHQALRKVQEQQQLLGKPLKACTRSFTSSLGLPCAHTLQLLQETNQNLSLQYFHPHWHLKRNQLQQQPVLEPWRCPTFRTPT